MLYFGETGRPLRTRFDDHWHAVIGNDAITSLLPDILIGLVLTSLLPDILIPAITVFQILKFDPSIPFLVATIAGKDTKCTSFLNLPLSTPMALMNIFPIFNSIFNSI
jgi:hypothetical protein